MQNSQFWNDLLNLKPNETIEELRSFTIKEFQDRILSTGYQNTVAVRAYYRIIWILLGASVLKQIGDSRAKANQKLGRTCDNAQVL